LLYGRPDLTIFDSKEQRQETLHYLRSIMHLAGLLGARSLVFGAPKNRQMKDLSVDVAEEIALEFFHAAAEIAIKYEVVLCIEPNPVHYECDYVTTSVQGLALVKKVNHPGFGLHLDAAGLTLSEENLEEVLVNCRGAICHFHASEPYLGPLGMGGVDHTTIGALLKRIEYPNWVSVEMRPNPDVDPIVELRRVVSFLQETYGH
jgi:sugar phosphate isomerase/epimerase